MTVVIITIDTELSAGRQAAGMPIEQNYALSIDGATRTGNFGIHWMMDEMDARGVRGVFFVDPMPGLVFGDAIVRRIVEPIVSRGHEVQLHLHTEWLNWAGASPVGDRTGRNIGDFVYDDQVRLLGWARDSLLRAGANEITAFRAGNFGANDDTLRALAHLGFAWDTSYNADYAGRGCAITARSDAVEPFYAQGLHELPVAGLWDRPGHFRPAQICAISTAELRAALAHAQTGGAHSFAFVTHSFEMLSRDRQRPNRIVMNRFAAACSAIAGSPLLRSGGFRDLAPPAPPAANATRLGPSRARTLWRMGEQIVANWLYDRQLKPA